MNTWDTGIDRRGFMVAAGSAAAAGLALTLPRVAAASNESYYTHAKGIRIFPGAWRPHYRWEHIAWVSPAWPCQDYLWLDFPEAIFTDQGLLYLSHVNPAFPAAFPDLPAVPWETLEDGIRFERALPNGLRFGGSVRRRSDTVVALELNMTNGSNAPLTGITLQTCAFLRAAGEFSELTAENKFVHVADRGWVPIKEAEKLEENAGPYRVGWRQSGRLVSDLPVIVTKSSAGDRWVAMTWLESTLSMVQNWRHPCMHADPVFPDLAPEASATIHGKLIFFEGTLDKFPMEELRQPEA